MQEKLDLNKTRSASTPEEVKRMHNVPYASAVGSIMYEMRCNAVRCTRPDVADDTKSQTGYAFVVNGGIGRAPSKVLLLGIVPTINEPIKMFCDNSAALHFAYESRVQKGARHYHRRYHYVRECIELGKIKILKVNTNDNLADPFKKDLSKGKLNQHARSMGLRLASSFM
nr:hypothetical protein [Tanacetum cinerariifolium]